MACPGGCIGGGGQPVPSEKEIREKRAEGLYRIDKNKKIKRADENPIVKARYFFDEWIKSSPEERNKLINDVRKVPRFTSDAFWRVFNKYKKDYNEANKEVKK